MKSKNIFSIFAAAAITVLSTSGNVFANFAPPVVPEPSTFLLMAVGAAGLGGYAWRKRRKK